MPRTANPHKAEFVAAILRGDPLKECGAIAGVTKRRAGQWAAELGFRRHYLSADEWAELRQRRQLTERAGVRP